MEPPACGQSVKKPLALNELSRAVPAPCGNLCGNVSFQKIENIAGWSSGSSSGSTAESFFDTLTTKLKGDIAEQTAVVHALQRGWDVLLPVGDRLPYDLVFDVEGMFIRIQVKAAWFDEQKGNYVVDNRRTQTNRRDILRSSYEESDFDFALVFLEDLDLFYVFPVEVFIDYGSEVHMVEEDKRQRKPRSAKYRGAWELMSQWATRAETPA